MGAVQGQAHGKQTPASPRAAARGDAGAGGALQVHARRWQDGWELRIVGHGVTWAPDLASAPRQARAFAGAPRARVMTVPTVDDQRDRLVLRARQALDAAEEARVRAVAAAGRALRALADAGVADDDAARLLGVPEPRLAEWAERSAPRGPAQQDGREADRS